MILSQAEKLLNKAWLILESPDLAKRDTRFYRAFLQRQMGNIANQKGAYSEAMHHYDQALTLFQQLEDLTWLGATCQNIWSSLAYRMGDFEKAAAVVEQGISCFRDTQDPGGLAWMLLALCQICEHQGQLQKAEQHCREALAIFQQNDNHHEIANAKSALGQNLFFQGQLDSAAAWLEQADATYAELGVTLHRLPAQYALGLVACHQGEYETAVSKFHTLLNNPDAHQWHDRARISIANIALATGDLSEATSQLKTAYLNLNKPDNIGERNELYVAVIYLTAFVENAIPSIPITTAFQALCQEKNFFRLLTALPGIARWQLAHGLVEQAITTYTVAAQYPFVANSRWFADVAGNEITSAAQKLPPEQYQAAVERARKVDLWETAVSLLEELEKDNGR